VPNNFVEHYGQPPAGVLVNSRGTPLAAHVPLSNFGPRLGFAWQPLGIKRLVIRGGAGIFYDRIGGDRFVHSSEAGDPYSVVLQLAQNNQQTNQTPWPTSALGFHPRWFDPSTGLGSNLSNSSLLPNNTTPLIRQYNFGFQYEFLLRIVLELSYVGSSGINLVDNQHNINPAQLASPSNPINGQTTNTLANVVYRVPFLGYNGIGSALQVTEYNGAARYNSLQATMRKQFSHGLSFQASYTWSKDLSDLSGASVANVRNPLDLQQQWGPTSFNRPQRFIINYAYDLPLGKHKGLLSKVVESWNLSGVTTVQSGPPFTATDNRAGTIFAAGTTQPAQLCAGTTAASIVTSGDIESRLGGKSGGAGFLNINQFCAPPVIGKGTGFGNSGLGILYAPGHVNFDASLIKNTRFMERQSIQFRAEFFNLMNHPSFGGPSAVVSSAATFGQITTTTTNARIIQLALKYNF
jgi:hypothetical protein